MKSIQDYKLEEQSFRGATLFGVLLILGYLVLRFVFEIDINVYQNPTKIFSLAILQIISYIALIITRVIAIIWTYRIAVKTERSGISWAIFAIIMPPVAMIAVANSKEKFENDEVKNIILKTRGDYNTKTSEVYNNHSLTKKEQNEKIEKIKDKYELKLKDRLVDLKANSLVEHLQLLKEQEEIDVDFDSSSQKLVLIKDIKNNITNLFGEFKRCPACNSIISDDAIICSECEIILK